MYTPWQLADEKMKSNEHSQNAFARANSILNQTIRAIDNNLGQGYASQNPQLICTMLGSITLDASLHNYSSAIVTASRLQHFKMDKKNGK